MTKVTGWKELKPHARAAADSINAKFNPPLSGGWRPGGTGEHPKGRAVDFMVYVNKTMGDAIAQYAVANHAQLGIWYVIWYRRIWSTTRPDEGWIEYRRANPHTDHVHISWHENPGTGGPIDDSDPIGDEEEGGALDAFKQFFQEASDPKTYLRIGLFFAGVILILIASFRLAFVQKAAKVAGKVVKNAR